MGLGYFRILFTLFVMMVAGYSISFETVSDIGFGI